MTSLTPSQATLTVRTRGGDQRDGGGDGSLGDGDGEAVLAGEDAAYYHDGGTAALPRRGTSAARYGGRQQAECGDKADGEDPRQQRQVRRAATSRGRDGCGGLRGAGVEVIQIQRSAGRGGEYGSSGG